MIPLLLISCAASELSQSWQLDRLRILGAQAEPAEPSPGDIVQFTSFVFAPREQDVDSVIWFSCLPEGATNFGCSLEGVSLDSLGTDNQDELSPEEQAELFEQLLEAGFAGVEPTFPPQWQVPGDALDGLDEADRLEGLSALATITALPSVEGADPEIGYKRFPVSEAASPNQNPAIREIQVDGTAYAEGDLFTASPGQEYEFDPVLAEESVETYSYTKPDGDTETREEEPYFTWYAEGGTLLQPFSLYPYNAAAWTAPEENFEGVLAVVVRDRRGGMNWSWLRVRVEP